MEPNTIEAGILEAQIAGTRYGIGIDLTKTYGAGSGAHYANPVDYVGRISDHGNLIRGRWSILDIDGSFEMRRDAEAEKMSELENAEENPT